MSFESRLTHFQRCFFGLGGSSQKRPFLRAIRAIPGLPLILISAPSRFGGGEPTFAGASCNDEDAPTPDLPPSPRNGEVLRAREISRR